jgi:pilus assembly protein CpaF
MLDATGAGDAAGTISTIHARSPLQAISRLQSLARRGPGAVPLDASAPMIADAIDFVVHIVARRDARGRKQRLVTSIIEITGVRGGGVTSGELMRMGPDGAEWVDPLSDRRRGLLAAHGYDLNRWVREMSA